MSRIKEQVYNNNEGNRYLRNRVLLYPEDPLTVLSQVLEMRPEELEKVANDAWARIQEYDPGIIDRGRELFHRLGINGSGLYGKYPELEQICTIPMVPEYTTAMKWYPHSNEIGFPAQIYFEGLQIRDIFSSSLLTSFYYPSSFTSISTLSRAINCATMLRYISKGMGDEGRKLIDEVYGLPSYRILTLMLADLASFELGTAVYSSPFDGPWTREDGILKEYLKIPKNEVRFEHLENVILAINSLGISIPRLSFLLSEKIIEYCIVQPFFPTDDDVLSQTIKMLNGILKTSCEERKFDDSSVLYRAREKFIDRNARLSSRFLSTYMRSLFDHWELKETKL